MLWGAGDFFGGLATRTGSVLLVVLVSQTASLAAALALSLVAGEPLPSAEAAVWAVAGGVAGLVGVTTLYRALAGGTMGLVAPLTGVIAAAVPALIGIASGEPFGPVLGAGFVLALVAVAVISAPPRGGVPGAGGSGRMTGVGFLLVVLAGLGFAGFYLGIDRAHEAGLGPVLTLVLLRLGSCLSVIVAIATLRGTGRIGRLHGDRRTVRHALTSAALGDVLGNLVYIVANSIGTLSVTVVLGSLYPASTVVLAAIVVHERLSRRQLGGVALALGGALLITAGSAAG